MKSWRPVSLSGAWGALWAGRPEPPLRSPGLLLSSSARTEGLLCAAVHFSLWEAMI